MQSSSELSVHDDARFELRHRRSPKSDSCGFAQLSKRATLFVIRDRLNDLNGAKRLNVLNDLNHFAVGRSSHRRQKPDRHQQFPHEEV